MASLLAVAGVASAIADQCNKYLSCVDCLKNDLCGWCSTPVVYRDGSPGAQCAGFATNGSANPFVCHGIYSTEACIQGWTCGPDHYCVLDQPGSGQPKDLCEANCSSVGLTYDCDNSTHTCKVAPAGMGTSLDQCRAMCAPPPVPAMPSAPTPPSAPNSPENMPPAPIAIQPGTPTGLIGNYRGVAVQNGYTIGEYYVAITNTSFAIYYPGGTVRSGTTSFPLGGNPSNQIWVQFSSSVQIKFLWQDAPDLSETLNILLAGGAPNGPCPTDMVSALTLSGGILFTLSECKPGTPCTWRAPNSVEARRSLHTAAPVMDHCGPMTTCETCLDQPFCGWCSQPVTYMSGQPGTQCAGFASNMSNPFTCNGTYSTETCPVLYVCDTVHHQCIVSMDGNGSSLADCMTLCPQQTYTCDNSTKMCLPAQPGMGASYDVCMMECNPPPASPSMPSTPSMMPPIPFHPGTPPILVGMWRGVEIDTAYQAGEWMFNFTDDGCTVYLAEASTYAMAFRATVATSDAGWIIFNITRGAGAGMIRVAQYQVSVSNVVVFSGIAMGAPGQMMAPSFDEAMTSASMNEWVIVKCADPACKFTSASAAEDFVVQE